MRHRTPDHWLGESPDRKTGFKPAGTSTSGPHGGERLRFPVRRGEYKEPRRMKPDTKERMKPDALETVADAIMKLPEVLGATPLNKHKGAWFCEIDKRWSMALNAHKESQRVGPEGGMDIDLEPFHCAVWYNGWLAGLMRVAPDGDWHGEFAAGEGANEATFIEAVKRRITTEAPMRGREE